MSGDAGFLGWIKYETLGETIVTSLRVKLGCLVGRLMPRKKEPDAGWVFLEIVLHNLGAIRHKICNRIFCFC